MKTKALLIICVILVVIIVICAFVGLTEWRAFSSYSY